MKKQTLTVKTRGGLESIAARLLNLPLEGVRGITVTIAPWQPPQTRRQRCQFEAIISEAARHFGYVGACEVAQFREQLLRDLEGADEVQVGSKIYFRRRTTTRHGREDMSETIERLLVLLAEYGYIADAPLDDIPE